ncbi:hypothetical protein ACKWTF_015833 [Chironomus riparius]
MHEHRLETVNDLLESDYEIKADEAFAFKIKDDIQFSDRIKLMHKLDEHKYNELILKQELVFIRKCHLAESDLRSVVSNRKFQSEFYYILPEQFLWHYIELDASYLNPFVERFQYYMDLSFQAGLPHMWKVLYNQDDFKTQNNHGNDEESIIKLDDLCQVFIIFITGCVVSIFVLVIEIFVHDCLKSLPLTYLRHRLRNHVGQIAYKKKSKDPKYRKGALYFIIHRHQKVKRLKRKKLQVRQNFLKP